MLPRFNPCKGFGVIGEVGQTLMKRALYGFNPCKGFGVIGARALGILTISGFQGSVARVNRIIAFLINGLAKRHLGLMLEE